MNTSTLFEFFKYNKRFSYRYYREQLDYTGKQIYDDIYSGFMSYMKNIRLNFVPRPIICSIYRKVLNDNPEIFFIKSVAVADGLLRPEYRFDMGATERNFEGLLNVSRTIIGDYNQSDIKKEQNIHDYFCSKTVYDYEYLNYLKTCEVLPFTKSGSECAGPLIFGKGVCGGIAKAAKLLFDLSGIKSMYVVSRSHAWNVVYIENIPYHVDITWDMNRSQKCGILRYDYFNLSDSEILSIGEEHQPLDLKLPLCKVDGNYYKNNNMYMRTPNDYRHYLITSLKEGKKDVVFKLPPVSDFELIKNRIFEITSDVVKNMYGSRKYHLWINEHVSVFHVQFL